MKRRQYIIRLFIAVMGWALVCFDQGSLFAEEDTARVISLSECLKKAVDYSPTLRTAALEQQRLKYAKGETMSAGLPQINANGSFDDYMSLPTSLIPGEFFNQPGTMIAVQFGTKYNLSGTIDVSQLLYNQTYLTSMKLAGMMMNRNELTTEKFREEVVYNVANLYYLTQAVLAQKENQQKNLARLDTMVIIAGHQYENGLIRKVDVNRIDVNRMNLQTAIDALETIYRQQLDMLKYYMGLDPSAEIIVPSNISERLLTPGNNPSVDNHIDLQLIRKDKELAVTGMNMVKAGYLPSLAAYGRYNYSSQDNTFSFFKKEAEWYEMSLVGIRLDIPLFDGLQKRSKIKQAQVQLQELSIQEEETKKMLAIQLQNAARKLKSSRDAWVRQTGNVKLAEDVMNVASAQYSQGMITITEVLTAHADLGDSQVGMVKAMVEMKNAELEYLKANGNILSVLN
ncbi:MAG TPA: TolC family protein [Bacteroidales bacterium]|nr:TolC family protein [Bacteroidales bacterium]HPS74084.1 TolC family protein [Bacteroidales bacterium]